MRQQVSASHDTKDANDYTHVKEETASGSWGAWRELTEAQIMVTPTGRFCESGILGCRLNSASITRSLQRWC